ncbi:MAG: TonB-dependent receptor plug domain-containing protein, partial [Gammaproteobacteria bacterium]|nr:TonB-dependent receptor plug domain-containing protein [Gemmatimonadota bacterium]NIU72454.1 TonB-dependent receptor plug domain-containing protein [Gammaproteobacteria bacterium]
LGLDEALAMVPGLQADDRHNLALGTRIAARGLGARAAFGVRGVRILVDGIPLTLPDGQTALTNLDLAAAGRIQVIRGPASVLYGNAAGGVISVDTREPPRAGIAEGRVLAGDYGTDELGALARFEATVGKGGETSYLVTASHLDLDGYRRHSAARRTGLNARLRHAPDEDSYVTVVVNAAAVPQAQSPGSVPADTLLVAPTRAWPTNVETKSGEQVEQLQAGISYVRRLGVHRLDLTAYGAGRALDNALPFAFIELGRWAGGLRAAVRSHLEPLGRPLHLTAGLDLEHQRDDRR